MGFRSANLVFSITAAELSKKYGNIELPFLRNMLGNLIAARRNLSLFQHHDGVTGTSKDHVMVDYADKYVKNAALMVIHFLK